MDDTRLAIAAGIAALVRAATTPTVALGYGRDLKCIDDLTTTLQEVGGIELLGQDLFHRITTARGTLVGDKDYGTDARDFCSGALTDRDLASIGTRLELECLKDDRVASLVVEATATAPGELSITLSVTPEDSTLRVFDLTLALTSESATLLQIT